MFNWILNRPHVQVLMKCLNTTFIEIEQFIGFQMSILFVSLASFNMHGSNEFRVSCIADKMDPKKYKLVRSYLQITIQKEHSNNLTKLDSTKHIQVRTCGQCCFLAQKTKCSIKDILSKCDQIRMKLQI